MKAKGIREERETIINFNDLDKQAYVWTASQTVYNRLKKRGFMPFEDNERSAQFEVLKAEVRLPSRKRVRKDLKGKKPGN